ncbi:hypothetical protein Syun_017846 [Stephania yunnanensis]|uniref:F-box domain-containing protein n=1 Tax=Stephania yunnanensis TaxID=152371 RepID=A0AAP0J7W4_9MAGN
MAENCNSRAFSWLVKSCIPNPQSECRREISVSGHSGKVSAGNRDPGDRETTLGSLPDDLLLECLSRVCATSLPAISLVCRRWSELLDSTAFYDLRRRRGCLRHAVFAVAVTDFGGVCVASHRIGEESGWNLGFDGSCCAIEDVAPEILDGSFAHARMAAIRRWIYVVGRNATFRYDTWSGGFSSRSAMTFPRKRFAAATVSGKIYVCGGAARTAAVEEYDPASDTWRVVAESPRRRYGCIGASVDGVFYVIGGLKIGNGNGCGNSDRHAESSRDARSESHFYASSMDLFDVKARAWLRSRAVPSGGCVVAACAAGGFIYVVASLAVELSFWRYDARRSNGGGGGGGEHHHHHNHHHHHHQHQWCRMKSPPLPAQVRLDGTVRFCCVGVGENVVLVQVLGCIDDLLRRSGRSCRGFKEGLVLVFDSKVGEWIRVADLPEIMRRAACLCVEC